MKERKKRSRGRREGEGKGGGVGGRRMKRRSRRWGRFPFKLTDNRKFFVFWEFVEFWGEFRRRKERRSDRR